jgi:methionyl-tRNA formyltransferase
MGKQSIIFLGSKAIGYECLAYLIAESEHLNIHIQGVLCNENSDSTVEFDLKKLAESNEIPVFSTPDEIPETDILYSVQYHKILKSQHIARAKKAALNLHMAPLPEYRGCNQFSFAIIDEKKEFGTTIHQLDERIDHGGILFEKRFPVPENCWIQQLYELTYAASLQLFKETLPGIVSGDYTVTSQQLLEQERGTCLHFRHEINSLKVIDLNWPADKIMRHIRATSMPGFEPPYVLSGDQKIYFSKQWK